jgi:hypothetical protein
MSRWQPWLTPGAIIIAGILVSASVAFVGRWGLSGGDNSNMTVYRLDRWSGQIEVCNIDMIARQNGGPWVYKCPFDPAAILQSQTEKSN